MTGVLYFDLGSPYAYLAVERAENVLGYIPELEPILLGVIFQRRGWGSWAETDQRPGRMAEIAARARRYGLPPVVWPRIWPADGLRAMRAATVAKEYRLICPFARSVFRQQFAEGQPLSDTVITTACQQAGIEPEAMLEAIETPQVKQALAVATDRAWEDGVRGVPSLRVGSRLFYGDDSLAEAARTGAPHA